MTLLRRLVFLAAIGAAAQAAEYPKFGLDVFDPQADGAALVEAGLARAAAEHKRVVLMFGANWCPWCHRLNDLFESDPTLIERFRRDFVLVKIDVNAKTGRQRNRDVVECFDKPTRRGLPAIVVLESDGTRLATQGTGAWEVPKRKRYQPKAVEAFFAQWAPSSRGGRRIRDEAGGAE